MTSRKLGVCGVEIPFETPYTVLSGPLGPQDDGVLLRPSSHEVEVSDDEELLLEEVAMRAFTPQGTCLQQVQTCRHPQFYSPCTTDTCGIRVTQRVPQPFPAGGPTPPSCRFLPQNGDFGRFLAKNARFWGR